MGARDERRRGGGVCHRRQVVKLLLDTHVLLWAVSDPVRLSAKARQAIVDPENELLASHVSLWELVIKSQAAPGSLPDLATIESDFEQAGVREWVPIQPSHIFGITQLPALHRDPFDRLLIAQARHEGLTLVTRDPFIHDYAVSVIW